MYSCADLSVSILVILLPASSLPLGRCCLSLSSASFRLCIRFRSRSLALTLLMRLMTTFSGPRLVLLLLLLLALAVWALHRLGGWLFSLLAGCGDRRTSGTLLLSASTDWGDCTV